MYDEEFPTEAQKAAYDNLDTAIQEYHHAHEDAGLVVDWILVVHLTDPQANGVDMRRTVAIGSDGQPDYRGLGLLDHGATTIRTKIANDTF